MRSVVARAICSLTSSSSPARPEQDRVVPAVKVLEAAREEFAALVVRYSGRSGAAS